MKCLAVVNNEIFLICSRCPAALTNFSCYTRYMLLTAMLAALPCFVKLHYIACFTKQEVDIPLGANIRLEGALNAA
jgi:hypothetical protein